MASHWGWGGRGRGRGGLPEGRRGTRFVEERLLWYQGYLGLGCGDDGCLDGMH